MAAPIPEENLATIPIQLRRATFFDAWDNGVSLRPGEVLVDPDTGAVRVGTNLEEDPFFLDPLSDGVVLRDIKCRDLPMFAPTLYGKPINQAMEEGLPFAATIAHVSELFTLIPIVEPLAEKAPFGIAFNPRLINGDWWLDFFFSGRGTIPHIADPKFANTPSLTDSDSYGYCKVDGTGYGEILFVNPYNPVPTEGAFFLGSRMGDRFYVGMDIRRKAAPGVVE